jgi:hypothetical protein
MSAFLASVLAGMCAFFRRVACVVRHGGHDDERREKLDNGYTVRCRRCKRWDSEILDGGV